MPPTRWSSGRRVTGETPGVERAGPRRHPVGRPGADMFVVLTASPVLVAELRFAGSTLPARSGRALVGAGSHDHRRALAAARATCSSRGELRVSNTRPRRPPGRPAGLEASDMFVVLGDHRRPGSARHLPSTRPGASDMFVVLGDRPGSAGHVRHAGSCGCRARGPRPPGRPAWRRWTCSSSSATGTTTAAR